MGASCRSITDTDKIEPQFNFFIKIIPDKTNSTFTIEDSGIGITKNEPLINLGTTAKSGIKPFMDAMAAGGGFSTVGQCGVGFFSALLAADTVWVVSRSNDDGLYIWELGAGGSFTAQKGTEMAHGIVKRGIKVSCYLKEDQSKILEARHLKELVQKHSEFIGFPIELHAGKSKEKEVTDSADGANEKKDVGEKEKEGVELKIEEAGEEKEKEAKKKKTKIVQQNTNLVRGEVKRGTKVICFLKENHSEFLQECRLTDLLKKHFEPFGCPTVLFFEKSQRRRRRSIKKRSKMT